MRRYIRLFAVLSVTGIFAYLIYARIEDKKGAQPGVAAAGPGGGAAKPKVPVKVLIPQPTVLEDRIMAKGSVLANEQVIIAAEIAGKVTRIHVAEGSRVAKGTLLFSLDDADLVAQIERTKAELVFLEGKAGRDGILKEKGGVSEEAYQLTIRDLEAKRADLRLLEVRLSKTKITAPFAGRTGLRMVSEGSYVGPAQKLTELVDDSRIKIDFTLPERYMHRISVGDRIRFSTEGTNGQFDGQVYAIEPRIDQATRTISVRAVSQAAGVLPGAYAQVEVSFAKIEKAIVLPTEAIIPESESKTVFVVRGGKAQRQEIQTGMRTSTHVQISKGIQPGDTVIVSGILSVKNGATVQVNAVL